jgi:hypothetical protein
MVSGFKDIKRNPGSKASHSFPVSLGIWARRNMNMSHKLSSAVSSLSKTASMAFQAFFFSDEAESQSFPWKIWAISTKILR